jgi:Kef-type K+ transport system membrane component KefB
MTHPQRVRVFNLLRIFLYICLSIAFLFLFFGFTYVIISGGVRKSDFPPLYISMPLIAAVVMNLTFLNKVRKFDTNDLVTQNNITALIVISNVLTVLLAAYIFYLQTFGMELAILIGITVIVTAFNVIYVFLGRHISRQN